jgi:hypothetical protein
MCSAGVLNVLMVLLRSVHKPLLPPPSPINNRFRLHAREFPKDDDHIIPAVVVAVVVVVVVAMVVGVVGVVGVVVGVGKGIVRGMMGVGMRCCVLFHWCGGCTMPTLSSESCHPLPSVAIHPFSLPLDG